MCLNFLNLVLDPRWIMVWFVSQISLHGDTTTNFRFHAHKIENYCCQLVAIVPRKDDGARRKSQVWDIDHDALITVRSTGCEEVGCGTIFL